MDDDTHDDRRVAKLGLGRDGSESAKATVHMLFFGGLRANVKGWPYMFR